MKTHWSRFGYTTACGKHLSGPSATRWLTRTKDRLTCKSCKRVVR